MEIKIDGNRDALPGDHPTVRVLSEDERALYCSLVETIIGAADDLAEHYDENKAVHLETHELTDAKAGIRAAATHTNLFEEAAAVRTALLDSEPFWDEVGPARLGANEAGGCDE